MLAHKPNGDCWYLGDGACTIHDEAPLACKRFDCREWFAGFTATEQEMLQLSTLDRDCANAALKLSV